jgi:CheY-like chemotaxis protein
VATALLEDLGLVVEVARDGGEAVQRAEAADYDLILMDVQMPVLDGRAATRAIRALARHARTPIVAMTANAFPEDRRACLEAGMDDDLVKPVNPAALQATLARWLGAAPVTATEASSGPAAALPALGSVAGLDVAAGLEAAHGQAALYLRVLEIFLRSTEPGALQAALASGDCAAARQLAHSLKGAAATIGADRLREASAELEADLAAGADMAGLADRAAALEAQLARLKSALAAALGKGDTPETEAPGSVPGLVVELAALLAASDMAAFSFFRAHEAALRGALGSAASRIARHLEVFAFEEALAELPD